jgi:YD repeat-containing protein
VTTRYAYGANNKLCRVLESATVNPADLDNPCTDVLPSGAPHTTTQNVDTQYGYDSADNLASQTTGAVPAAGVVAGTTTWVYDGQGNVTSETDPDGNVDGATDAIRAAHTKTFTYDAAGNTTGETDPDTASGAGPTISYAFDAADRQCRRVAANPGVVLQTLANPCSTAATGATIDTRYGYDAAGNQISATDALASRTISSTYDQLSRPLTVSGDQTGDPGTTYTYDFDNPTRTDPSGAYTASLDAYGRQVGLTDPLHSSGNLYSWTYAPSGDVATSSDPTGNTTTNTYDPLGRPTARSTSGASGCSTCAAYTFTYNNAGNELTRVSTISGDTANGTTTFAYDALDRVTTYTPPAVISPQTYTWNGQPDRASIQTGTGTPLTVTFDAAGRPISDSSSGTYSSDGQGRITAVPGKTMTYDALGRLTRVVAGASTANYTYDALDRLRTINVGAATNRFRYVGTTDAVAQIIDNLSGTVLTNHATDLDGTELFDFAPGGSSQVYLGRNDHGDVTWSATTTGAVSARVSYDPYGNVAASSGTTPASRWQGSYYDSTSGFYYVNARWYAPSLGTFLSED